MDVAGNSQLPETGKRTVSFIVIKNEQTSMTTQNRRKNSDIPLTEATPEQAISYIKAWIDNATHDAKAAEILHSNMIFNLSCYHLEQAVEKISKAFGFIMEYITPEDAATKIKHQPLKLIHVAAKPHLSCAKGRDSYQLRFYRAVLSELIGVLSRIYAGKNSLTDEEIKKIFKLSSKEMESYFNQGYDYLQKISRGINIEEQYPIFNAEMNKTKDMHKTVPTVLRVLHADNEFKELTKLAVKDEIHETFDEIGVTKDMFPSNYEESEQELLDTIDSQDFINDIHEFILSIHIWNYIKCLSSLTNNIEINTRYPELKTSTNPIEIYTKNHVIVRNMRELIAHTNNLISLVSELFEIKYKDGKISRGDC